MTDGPGLVRLCGVFHVLVTFQVVLLFNVLQSLAFLCSFWSSDTFLPVRPSSKMVAYKRRSGKIQHWPRPIYAAGAGAVPCQVLAQISPMTCHRPHQSRIAAACVGSVFCLQQQQCQYIISAGAGEGEG